MFWKVLLKVLASICVGFFALVGAVILVPFAVLALIISMPFDAVSSLWEK